MKCAVWNCPNKRGSKNEKKSFFSFPREPLQQKKWIQFCKQTKPFNRKTWQICMDHFDENDICGGLRFEMGFSDKRLIRPGAIPCIQNDKACNERDKRLQRRKNKKIVEALLAQNSVELQAMPDLTPSVVRVEESREEYLEVQTIEDTDVEANAYIDLSDIEDDNVDNSRASLVQNSHDLKAVSDQSPTVVIEESEPSNSENHLEAQVVENPEIEFIELGKIDKVTMDSVETQVRDLEKLVRVLRRENTKLCQDLWRMERRKDNEITELKTKLAKSEHECSNIKSKLKEFLLSNKTRILQMDAR